MSLEDASRKLLKDLAEEAGVAYHSWVPFMVLGDLIHHPNMSRFAHAEKGTPPISGGYFGHY